MFLLILLALNIILIPVFRWNDKRVGYSMWELRTILRNQRRERR